MLLFVGDDWAEEHHDIEVQDEGGRVLGRVRLPEGAAGVTRLHAMLSEYVPDGDGEPTVIVGIETDRGPWVQALLTAGYQVYRSTRSAPLASESGTACPARRAIPVTPTSWRTWCARTATSCARRRVTPRKPRWDFDPLGRRWVRTDRWDTGFVDLHSCQGLLGQAEGRTSATVTGWLLLRSKAFREAVRYVVIDPAASYRAAITTQTLPNARLVVDHFHLVKLANDAVTAVRRRITWELRNRRGRKIDPEWANRRRLLTARERLHPAAMSKMWTQLLTHDPTGQILAAWIAKEELRTLLASAREHAAPHVIRARLHDFYAWCADTDIPEVHRLATTVDAWWPETLLFLQTGLTNARTEGINRIVKDVGRRACGFRNPRNHRRRVRLICTRRRRQGQR